MRTLFILVALLFCTGIYAQEFHISQKFPTKELPNFPELHTNQLNISFSGDSSTFDSKSQILELKGNVQFSTSIVEIAQADKIVYNRITKEFTISGFKEIRINGEIQLAEDFGRGTLKFELGDCVAYLVTE